VERCRVYYKGEGGGFLQVRAVVSLACPSCPWLILAPKVFQLCTNHFVLVLCRLVWVSKACQFFLIPSRSSSTPFYPSKVLRARECAPIPCSFDVFCLGFTFESFKELGAHQTIFMRSASHNYWRRLVLNFQKNKRMWTIKNYMKLAEEEEEAWFFFWEWEKLSFDSTT